MLVVGCAKKDAGLHEQSVQQTTSTTGTDATSPPRAQPASMTATPATATSWHCFKLGNNAADTQCESSEADCRSLLDLAREGAPQAAARTSCTAHAGPVFCFEETESSGVARLCSATPKGCDDARKGAVAEETKRPTGQKIGACVETR